MGTRPRLTVQLSSPTTKKWEVSVAAATFLPAAGAKPGAFCTWSNFWTLTKFEKENMQTKEYFPGFQSWFHVSVEGPDGFWEVTKRVVQVTAGGFSVELGRRDY